MHRKPHKKRMLIIVNPYATTVSDRLRNLVVYALQGRFEVEAVSTEDVATLARETEFRWRGSQTEFGNQAFPWRGSQTEFGNQAFPFPVWLSRLLAALEPPLEVVQHRRQLCQCLNHGVCSRGHQLSLTGQ